MFYEFFVCSLISLSAPSLFVVCLSALFGVFPFVFQWAGYPEYQIQQRKESAPRCNVCIDRNSNGIEVQDVDINNEVNGGKHNQVERKESP
jgi:hypothetical protein